MSSSLENLRQVQNFLSTALQSNRPDTSMESQAIAIYEIFSKRTYFLKEECLNLTKLQLLLQKLCRFELAVNIRDMLPLVLGVDGITKSKIQVDNLILPKSIHSLLPAVRSKDDVHAILSFIKLLQVLDDFSFKAPDRGITSRPHSAFLSRISGKKVAIVGPANAKVYRGSEIDDYDIVVRINIKGDDALPNFKSHGRKTDVIYLNGMWTDKFDISNYAQLLASSCHFVWRKKKKPLGIINSHSLFGVEKLELSGSYLMLPRVILDLLRFNPTSLSIFYNDFYAGEQIYEPEFRSTRKNHDIWHLADHDLLTSLRFLNIIMLNSVVPVKFIDLEFGESILDITKYATLIQRRNTN